MSALLTIPEIITVGDVSIYFSGNDNASGVLFGKRLSSPKSPVEIAALTDALRWQYEDLLTNNDVSQDDTLRGTANYLVWMCGRYGLQAQGIIAGSGGGSVIPVPMAAPLPYQFIVDASTSFIIDGASSKTISLFVGYNLLFTRGGIAQSTVSTESSYYSWDKTTGLFSITPAAVTSELFQIYAI